MLAQVESYVLYDWLGGSAAQEPPDVLARVGVAETDLTAGAARLPASISTLPPALPSLGESTPPAVLPYALPLAALATSQVDQLAQSPPLAAPPADVATDVHQERTSVPILAAESAHLSAADEVRQDSSVTAVASPPLATVDAVPLSAGAVSSQATSSGPILGLPLSLVAPQIESRAAAPEPTLLPAAFVAASPVDLPDKDDERETPASSENHAHTGHGGSEEALSPSSLVVPPPTIAEQPEPPKSRPTSASSNVSTRIPAQFVIPPFQPRPSSSASAAPTLKDARPGSRESTTSAAVITRRASLSNVSKEGQASNGKREKRDKDPSTRSKRVLGEYTMSKTLGAGSMGKVKLGISSVTGEKVAIKIIPRFTSTAAALRPHHTSSKDKDVAKEGGEGEDKERRDKRAKDRLPPSASYLASAAAKDASKEVRTSREASMCLLLHHPYVCGMKSMVLYPHHYYMVFDYVNGGQLLDYIISHGRLRERSARKFARQIGSALQYCHANSIVHRDLKIENILISKTGNIKIIDFGLSNLYSPLSHLHTFCGSLYFAAPELLNARPYTGPEVDVWSFGIVLYVLVCGKVPFDDQSKPALHAKIKRGHVEYPEWLSAECKHLLSRMLITSPSSRATLTQVLAHPWMTKGFPGPPSDHLPPRVPLSAAELDPAIIKGMLGFEFGSEESIAEQLRDVLQSELYAQAVAGWESKNAAGRTLDEAVRPSTRTDGKDMKDKSSALSSNKRFSGLGFYSKKLAGGLAALAAKPDDATLATPSSTTVGEQGETADPTRGFHPLISIYYLVREKLEREKIWGPGVFASSTLSLNGPPGPPAPQVAYQLGAGTLAAPPTTTAPVVLAPLSPQPRQRATVDEFPRPTPAFSQSPPGSPSVPAPNYRASMFIPPTPPATTDPTPLNSLARRFGSLIGRSASTSEGEFKRHRAPRSPVPLGLPQVAERTLLPAPVVMEPPPVTGVRRASTIGSLSAAARSPAAAPPRPLTATPDFTPATAPVEAFQEAKPVYLKGLFSVATTSTKPTAVIRADLVRVLDRLGVQHRDLKAGFECLHAPSIDLASVTTPRLPGSSPGGRGGTLRRQASKLLPVSPRKDLPTAPAGDSPSSSTSFTLLAPPPAEELPPPTAAVAAPPSDLVVRFEIAIVKMPLLPGMHGLQFRRIAGDAWSYQQLAKRVLHEFALK